jgi:tRNA U34 5-methylaminomethyl-2-thiouridine-forming methyltransferase MnmC
LKREIVQTSDGSTTIYLPDWNESYHSKHGAIQEAYHVFIKNGLYFSTTDIVGSPLKEESISILEIGFGTGLNSFITFLESEKLGQKIDYVGIEAYPVLLEEALQMNYAQEISPANDSVFQQMHECSWEQKNLISANFTLTKQKKLFQELKDQSVYDLIYFDAFGFRVQPELWSEALFQNMYTALKSKGVLVTYACRTSIKNAMLSAGFSVEKLPGAPGKREMLRASKGY